MFRSERGRKNSIQIEFSISIFIIYTFFPTNPKEVKRTQFKSNTLFPYTLNFFRTTYIIHKISKKTSC